jgi:replicative DNA helicase
VFHRGAPRSPHLAHSAVHRPAGSVPARFPGLSVHPGTTSQGRLTATPHSDRIGGLAQVTDGVVELPSARSGHSASAPEFERTPPQDIAAEQSVIGGMLLSKDAIADVVEVVRSTDFYRPAHQTIFDVVVDMYGKGEPADAITVSAELTRTGEIGRVGGAPYLHTLMSSVPTAANAGYYARIVAEQAILRRLVEAGTRIVQLGYATGLGDVDDVVDRAQQAVYDVTEKRTSEDYALLEELMQPTMDELEAIGSRGGSMTGVPTGFSDLDTLTNGLHPGQLIIVAARPALGKSTLALDVARSCSIKHGMTSVIFSLEMTKTEITMRLLSAEARVPLHHMRAGTMTDEDWARLARRMGEVADAPLFIDDSPNLTMMEIRAKARRLKQRHNLKLVVVDYLQLMQGNKRAESRQQEVSELSRSLKLLAKELDCPVIAVSQLNRGPEQRQDKKPLLSDLRESGCLPATTRILRADTGAETTIGELFATGARDVPVWSLDESLRYVRRHLTHAFSTGVREVFRVRLASGKTVRATANHPFLTYQGWQPLDTLAPGTRIAVPRHIPAPEAQTAWADAQVVQLAHAHEKFVPAEAFSLPKQQIRLFLRHLWATDGSVTTAKSGRAGRVYYASSSRRLVDDVSLLLLRFGISSRVRAATPKGEYRQMWTLDIHGVDDQKRFLGEIGVHGARASQVDALLAAINGIKANTNVDTVPVDVWDKVKAVLLEQGKTRREFAAAMGTSFCGSTMWKHAPSRERLARVAAVLDDGALALEATNDVLWDRVVAIEADGVEEVFDATVVGNHNFIADGVAVHNSIEQDADMVILLNREDAYEKESPRAGEADFIVAKHRNGPTATITVAFQGHYSRFVDMSPA